MANPKVKTKLDKQEELYDEIIGALVVPVTGKPLEGKRKWLIPCPDDKAFDDYQETDDEKRKKWKKDWTTCIKTENNN